jgi:hypothetical protein
MKAGIAACVALSGRLTRQSPSRGREPPAYPDPFCRRFARVTRQSCIGVFLCLTGFPFGIAAQQRPATRHGTAQRRHPYRVSLRSVGRYQIIPVAGVAHLDTAAAAKVGRNYLFEDLPKRLAKGRSNSVYTCSWRIRATRPTMAPWYGPPLGNGLSSVPSASRRSRPTTRRSSGRSRSTRSISPRGSSSPTIPSPRSDRPCTRCQSRIVVSASRTPLPSAPPGTAALPVRCRFNVLRDSVERDGEPLREAPDAGLCPGIAFNLAVQYHLVNRTVEY